MCRRDGTAHNGHRRRRRRRSEVSQGGFLVCNWCVGVVVDAQVLRPKDFISSQKADDILDQLYAERKKATAKHGH